MCMSVPQIAVLAISISTSLGPTLGSGMSSSQIPGAACCLTSAFMICSLKHAELAADAGEGVHGALELLARERRGQLRADARLPFGDRSEEHTSELQSPCNLVCRLLLEKKKRSRADLPADTTNRDVDYLPILDAAYDSILDRVLETSQPPVSLWLPFCPSWPVALQIIL